MCFTGRCSAITMMVLFVGFAVLKFLPQGEYYALMRNDDVATLHRNIQADRIRLLHMRAISEVLDAPCSERDGLESDYPCESSLLSEHASVINVGGRNGDVVSDAQLAVSLVPPSLHVLPAIDDITDPFSGYPLLMLAIKANNLPMVQWLLLNGADPSAIAAVDGRSALHMAVVFADGLMTRTLIENGADVNAKADNGWTPLHYGVLFNSEEHLRCLLLHGADPNAYIYSNTLTEEHEELHLDPETEIRHQARLRREREARLFDAYEGDDDTLWGSEGEGEGGDAAQWAPAEHQEDQQDQGDGASWVSTPPLADRQPLDVEFYDEQPAVGGFNALQLAISYSYIEMIQMLLEYGARVREGEQFYAHYRSMQGRMQVGGNLDLST